MKTEPIVSSETSASNTQTSGIYPKESELHLQHGENLNLKSRSMYLQMAAELIAAPLYFFRLLLKIMSLSYVYRVTVLIPYSL
jgi:hypothetical protein